MILRHASTPDLSDQEAAGVPGGAAYRHDRERRLAPDGARAEPRPRVLASRRGLRRPAERTNSWPGAAGSGAATPEALQPRRRRALWDAEAGREERRHDIGPQLADAEAVLGRDETGFLHKGRPSAGGARPYRGPAGPGDTGQMGVWLG